MKLKKDHLILNWVLVVLLYPAERDQQSLENFNNYRFQCSNNGYKVNSPAGEYAILYATRGQPLQQTLLLVSCFIKQVLQLLTASVISAQERWHQCYCVWWSEGASSDTAFTPSGQTINQALTRVSISGLVIRLGIEFMI